MKVPVRNIERLDAHIEPMLRAARIPGAAVALVVGAEVAFARGYGYRDIAAKLPVTTETIYPIASTTKPMNAVLLGMLVDEGRLAWDAPVQEYLPRFHLKDALISSRVTLRDLVTMRTGLPRHDAVWIGSRAGRAELMERLAHLDLSADFRQRFQYSNLSVTVAGHIAEVVTGKSWEALVRQRIFRPLGMRKTCCARPGRGNVTLSYHENKRRKLLLTRRRACESTAPSGGAVHSTIMDMARWLSFNLKGGTVRRRRLISAKTLAQIHAPQIIIGDRPLARLPSDAAYALGWLVDSYNGHARISHGGYLHDVSSSTVLFPSVGIGMVSFVNFGCPLPADLINQYVFDVVMGLKPAQTLEQALAQYEARIEDTCKRNASVARTLDARPSHPLHAYAGRYQHAAYGEIKIRIRGRKLVFQRDDLVLPLQHWHYDAWVAEDDDTWTIHQAHPFDRASQIRFHADARGAIAALSISLEPEVAPIRFAKQGRTEISVE